MRILGTAVAASVAIATSASAVVVFNVNSTLDQIDDDTFDGVCHTAANTCTLRAAVMQANVAVGAGATIVLPAGTYRLTRTATGGDGPDSGDLDFTPPASGNPVISIVGAGQSTTIIDANHQNRILEILSGRTATLARLTLRNGYVSAGSLGGGAILNYGELFLDRCTVSGNVATEQGGDGGAIVNLRDLYLRDSTISGNSSGQQGGGIYSNFFTSIERSSILANLASRDGGGIASTGVFYATASTIGLNTAHGDGGGIYMPEGVGEDLRLINTTIYGNGADGNGGGIYFGSPPQFDANVFNSTIAWNDADVDADPEGGNGGGIYVAAGSGLHIRNTLVAGNYLRNAPIYEDCWGTVNSYGRNMFWEPGDGCFIAIQSGSAWSLDSLDGLGPAQINGGSTATIALLAGSNAIDGGDPQLGCIGPDLQPFATDQRGAARSVGARCDVGAFEYGALPAGFLFSDGFEAGNFEAWGW